MTAWAADTAPRRDGCTPADLLAAVTQIARENPAARLVRNPVGNLAVMVDGEMVGFLDLTSGRYVET